ncbi:hypothetical protein Vi05172_g2529 [Venturia inaequalis]|nr:hypothetical protein Vi05172_g2529 [Venturia inaequalis]
MSFLTKTNTKSIPPPSKRVWGNGTTSSKNQCGHCHDLGHLEAQCWIKNPRLKTICDHCGVFGHNISICWYLVRPSQTLINQKQKTEATHTNLRDTPSGKSFGDEVMRITDMEEIASYNGIHGDEKTIFTPGQPPKWTQPENTIELATDGSACLHLETPIQYPMAPAISSILHAKPIFRCSDVNFFGCGATLGELFRYAQKPEHHSALRIRIDLIGDTVFLTRLSPSSGKARRDAGRYRRGYTASNTESEVGIDSIGSHRRIIGYKIGGLKIVLQFQVDAYIEDKLPNRHDGGVAKNLSTYLSFDSTTNLTAISSTRALPTETKIIPQSALMRIETRSNSSLAGHKVVRSQLHRLWLRQVPSFALAWHFDGKFHPEDVKEMDVSRCDFAEFETDSQETIRKFISLLKKLEADVRATSSGKMLAFCEKGGTLETLELAPNSAAILPKNLENRWRIGASRASPAIKTQAQTINTFSGTTRPHDKQPSMSKDEDLIDLRSISDASQPPKSGQAATVPEIHPSPVVQPSTRLATTYVRDQPQSTTSTHRTVVSAPALRRPATVRPVPMATASKIPISISKVPNMQVVNKTANSTSTKDRAASPTIAKDKIANFVTVRPQAANTLSAKIEETSMPPPIASIKDHPNYTWLAPLCLFGISYTIAALGVVIGFAFVVAICVAAYSGYVLRATITNVASIPTNDVPPEATNETVEPVTAPYPSMAAVSITAEDTLAVSIVTAPEAPTPSAISTRETQATPPIAQPTFKRYFIELADMKNKQGKPNPTSGTLLGERKLTLSRVRYFDDQRIVETVGAFCEKGT